MVDVVPAPGALPGVLETIARLQPFTARDFGSLLQDELEDENAAAECVVIAARLRPDARAAVARLKRDRRTSVVFVGHPGEDEARWVDLVVPADLEWRTADALALHP